jgi:hypothetical protein
VHYKNHEAKNDYCQFYQHEIGYNYQKVIETGS